jgi:hypothetical protein
MQEWKGRQSREMVEIKSNRTREQQTASCKERAKKGRWSSPEEQDWQSTGRVREEYPGVSSQEECRQNLEWPCRNLGR